MSTETLKMRQQRTSASSVKLGQCRFCGKALRHVFVDLGMSPLCESYLPAEQLDGMEAFYPLVVYVCGNCLLVQLAEYVSGEEIFSEYAYFSSYSDSWLEHCRKYTQLVTKRFGLNGKSKVVELGSNDGYLLRYFMEQGIPVLGIEPAVNVALLAMDRGISTIVEFFSERLARQLAGKGETADLIVGNNVLAQVPDINDFVEGIRILLKPGGVVTIEFPHLMRLVEGNQLDTIYHEHYSYFSLLSSEKIFAAHGLKIFDVDELKSHGGSLRIYACHTGDSCRPAGNRVIALKSREINEGYDKLDVYGDFAEKAKQTKRRILKFFIDVKSSGGTVAGYGAPGKGNTLLNYCGIRTDFIDYTVDRNPYKQGKFLPGTHVPIYPVRRIFETKPDYLFILPWNLKDEIMNQMRDIRDWGGRFVVPIPEITVYE